MRTFIFRWSPLLCKVHQTSTHIDTALCNQNVVKAESFKYVYVWTLHALFLPTTHKCKFIHNLSPLAHSIFLFPRMGLTCRVLYYLAYINLISNASSVNPSSYLFKVKQKMYRKHEIKWNRQFHV